VLITGALGFFGSHLADRYSELGWYVCGMDNLTANVVSVTHPTIDSMMIGDARALTPKHVASVDLVVHAASPVGAAGILSAQGTIAGQIVAATQTVVDACVVADVPLVNVSTSEVYGITGVACESDPFVVPNRYSARLEYQAGKIAAESRARNFGDPKISHLLPHQPWSALMPSLRPAPRSLRDALSLAYASF
jgi:nucleoside-diphosphate-sugar epimerase